MRTIASLALWITCSLMLFIIGVLVTFKANLYGTEEFNGNAGAGFAVLMEGILIGLLFGLCGIPITLYLSKRIPWLRG